MFGIRIANLDTGSYLRMTLYKALAKAEKEKKDLYLQACLKSRKNFTPMVYSADGITSSARIRPPLRVFRSQSRP